MLLRHKLSQSSSPAAVKWLYWQLHRDWRFDLKHRSKRRTKSARAKNATDATATGMLSSSLWMAIMQPFYVITIVVSSTDGVSPLLTPFLSSSRSDKQPLWGYLMALSLSLSSLFYPLECFSVLNFLSFSPYTCMIISCVLTLFVFLLSLFSFLQI